MHCPHKRKYRKVGKEVNFGWRGVLLLLTERGQPVGKRKYRQMMAPPEFSSERDERIKIFTDSCIRNLDNLEALVSKLEKTVSRKILVADRWKCNTARNLRGRSLSVRGK